MQCLAPVRAEAALMPQRLCHRPKQQGLGGAGTKGHAGTKVAAGTIHLLLSKGQLAIAVHAWFIILLKF